MKILDFYLNYIHEAEASADTILDMQKSKCQYLRRLFDDSRKDLGGNDAKTIRLKSKLDSCENKLDQMEKKFQNKGSSADLSTNVGQGVGKTANLQRRHEAMARQAKAQAEVNQAASTASEQYHTILSQAAGDCLDSGDKSGCMKKYRLQAIQTAKSELARGMTACSHTKDPSKCFRKLRKKLDKYNDKLRKLTT